MSKEREKWKRNIFSIKKKEITHSWGCGIANYFSSKLYYRVMVFNATFNNISVISWRSILLMEETGVPRENHRPAASHWPTSSHHIMLYRVHLVWAVFELATYYQPKQAFAHNAFLGLQPFLSAFQLRVIHKRIHDNRKPLTFDTTILYREALTLPISLWILCHKIMHYTKWRNE
jgi:hypothetical protein